jgi:hypothetical protein
MPRNADVYDVFIASPGDAGVERGIISDVILSWNAVFSKTKSVVLQPIKWETHIHPALLGRPQKIINEKILMESDLLISVFRHRLGSSSGAYISGTIEEIEEFRRAGKSVLLYFFDTPPDDETKSGFFGKFSVDYWIQYSSRKRSYENRLRDFNDLLKYRSLYMGLGIIGSYKTTQEFREKINHDLSLVMEGVTRG